MGSCCAAQKDLPTLDTDVQADGNTCCTNISDSCPSSCCVIVIRRTNSKKDVASK